MVVRVPYQENIVISEKYFKNRNLKNKAVLVHTGWDIHWNTDAYYTQHPYLTENAAQYLRDEGAVLVGIDSHNIDNTIPKNRPVHSTLLGAEILIVEHLCNLQALPLFGFTFSAVPPKFKGVGTFPVRAMAKIKK